MRFKVNTKKIRSTRKALLDVFEMLLNAYRQNVRRGNFGNAVISRFQLARIEDQLQMLDSSVVKGR